MEFKRIEDNAPNRKSPCPCGSGSKFKNCCIEGYKNSDLNKGIKEFNNGNYKQALKEFRYHLTWYILAHNSHTVPLLKTNTPVSQLYFNTDIEALGEQINFIHQCYHRLGIGKEFGKTLVRLENIVNSSKWKEYIIYETAFHLLVDLDDSEEAYKELTKIDIADSSSENILTLYLDVSPPDIPITDTINLLDRIINITNDKVSRLKYTTCKGLLLHSLNYSSDSIDIISKAINTYKKSPNSNHFSDYFLAESLVTLYKINHKEELVEEALKIYKQELLSTGYTDFGLSGLHYATANCLYYKSEYQTAIEHYEKSFTASPSPHIEIAIINALAFIDLPKAKAKLESIEPAKLESDTFYDYAMSWATIAYNSNCKNDIQNAINYLKEITETRPLLSTQIDKTIIGLQGILINGKKTKDNTFKIIFDNFEIKPGLFGISFNVKNSLQQIMGINKK